MTDEALCRPDRAGSPRARHHQRGRGQPHLPGLRGGAAREVSRPPPRCSTRWPTRRCATARRLFDLYRKKFGEYIPLIRRQDVKGFVRHKPIWLVRPLGLDEVRKYAAEHGVRDRAVLSQGGGDGARRLDPPAARSSSPRPRTSTRTSPSGSSEQHPHAGRARRGGRDRAPHVRAAIRAAGPRRTDGRLGVDAGAAVRRRLRHPPHLGDLPGRSRRLGRRRHLDGLRRGAVGRRLAHRPRHALAARHGLRR